MTTVDGNSPTNAGTIHRPRTAVWLGLAIVWALVLCFLLDPKPLAAPAWALSFVRSVLGCTEPVARIIAALLIRLGGIGVLGGFLMLASGERGFTRRSFLFLLLAPVLAVVTMWVNYRYFPIHGQVKLIAMAAVSGALAGLVLRRSWMAAGVLGVLIGAMYFQFTGYDVDDELAAATQAQLKELLARAPSLPDGDAGFLQLTTRAFELAAVRSRGSDPLVQNKAAILALALMLGHEKLAGLADRHVDPSVLAPFDSLRARLSIHERPDWVRHFCVSAGLTVLKTDDRSLAIGILKELKDANPGGSGFSFGDLTADAAGNRFALAATRDEGAAMSTQERVSSGIVIADLFPDVRDLPEGLTAEDFRARFGGIGGAGTDSLVQVITQRLDACRALQ